MEVGDWRKSQGQLNYRGGMEVWSSVETKFKQI